MTSTPTQAPAVVALSLLRADVREPYGRPETWPRWAALLPHVLEWATAAGHVAGLAWVPRWGE